MHSATHTSDLSNFFFQEWISILAAKSEFFKAIAEYHMARVAKDKAAYGEGVTRFKVS